MHLSRRSAVGLLVMNALAGSAAVDAQVLQQQPRGSAPPTGQPGIPDLSSKSQAEMGATSPLNERMKSAAAHAYNDERRKRMLADTEKLLTLSAELKANIEKSTKDELSMDVIRKAAEIEKLAHDVQQRMKN